MTWLSWRLLRAQAATVWAAAAAAALVLALTGPGLADRARSTQNVFDALTSSDRRLFYAGVVALAVAPGLLGAFCGAPLVARELENGTHRLVWVQSVSRSRWLATRLGLEVGTAAAGVGVLATAVTRWADPVDGARSSTHGALPGRLTPVTFAMRGVVPVGWAVLAVVLGAAVGAVLRRSLPAMAVTVALVVAAQVAVPLWVRPHLAAPVQEVVPLDRDHLDGIAADATGRPVRLSAHTADPDDWVLTDETVDASGAAVGLPGWFADCVVRPPEEVPPASAGPVRAPDLTACLDRLGAEGYRQHLVYQAAGRFWTLQWRETGLLLALSGLLATACSWWVRRRLT